jgi:DNA-binding NarL/FixJ family response regulator
MAARLLIVDDHEPFRRLASRLLAEAGFRVVGEAADGASALREMEQLQPDLVLLDIVLPDMSGFDVAAAIADRGVNARVVLTSSRTSSDLGGSEWPAGCIFVPKHELTAARLRAALDSA